MILQYTQYMHTYMKADHAWDVAEHESLFQSTKVCVYSTRDRSHVRLIPQYMCHNWNSIFMCLIACLPTPVTYVAQLDVCSCIYHALYVYRVMQ